MKTKIDCKTSNASLNFNQFTDSECTSTCVARCTRIHIHVLRRRKLLNPEFGWRSLATGKPGLSDKKLVAVKSFET